ncbi:MAG: hypothetical protein HQL99_17230, partial [Magnetococcales bacterium]|nr:hypothetical protein [Magnetococcales bacterium]
MHEALKIFTAMQDIPSQMPRHNEWRLFYHRNPYMRCWSIEDLRDCWDEVLIITSLEFIIHSPFKPGRNVVAISMEKFTHLLEEIAFRGLTLLKFKYESGRMPAAAKRIDIPATARQWVEKYFK